MRLRGQIRQNAAIRILEFFDPQPKSRELDAEAKLRPLSPKCRARNGPAPVRISTSKPKCRLPTAAVTTRNDHER